MIPWFCRKLVARRWEIIFASHPTDIHPSSVTASWLTLTVSMMKCFIYWYCFYYLIIYKRDNIHKELFSITVRPVIIVETPIVSGRVGQEEPVVLECLIEAYPKGIHFWEHVRGKNFIFIRLFNEDVFFNCD